MVVAAIGCGKKISPVDVDVSKLDRQPGDLYIVASDGICKTADIDSNELISKVLEMLTSRGTDSEQIASQLLQYVKHAVPHDKRRDDITIGVLQDKK